MDAGPTKKPNTRDEIYHLIGRFIEPLHLTSFCFATKDICSVALRPRFKSEGAIDNALARGAGPHQQAQLAAARQFAGLREFL
jgi:hypothetical protein